MHFSWRFVALWLLVGAVLAGMCIFFARHSLVTAFHRDREHTVSTEHKDEPPPLSTYIQVTEGCGVNYEGACVQVRARPSTTSEAVAKLRTGIVLKVGDTVTENGRTWYKISFDEWVRYPERVAADWYVAADVVEHFEIEPSSELAPDTVVSSTKRILVDRSDQTMKAYDGDTLFMETPISTGLDLTPTPRGTFRVYRKTPTRYMQGPLPGISDQYYDLPGVPWNLYFTNEGGALHGAYWHANFGQQWSHGCVNLPLAEAEKLYRWADLGTTVVVRD